MIIMYQTAKDNLKMKKKQQHIYYKVGNLLLLTLLLTTVNDVVTKFARDLC